MALGFFARAMKAGLSRLGEPSSLAGVPIGNVAIEFGVEVFDGTTSSIDAFSGVQSGDGQMTVTRDVATIESTANPQVGQTLVHPDGTFKLSRLVEDNGATMDFILIRVPA